MGSDPRPATVPLGIFHRPTAPPLGIGNREWGIVGMGNDAAGEAAVKKRRRRAGWGGLPPRFPIPDCRFPISVIADSQRRGARGRSIPVIDSPPPTSSPRLRAALPNSSPLPFALH